VRVGFVVHRYDLASSLYPEGDVSARFLRAERAGGRRGTTSWLEEGPPLPTSFGVSLHEAAGGWS
jgi:hypothetical protein